MNKYWAVYPIIVLLASLALMAEDLCFGDAGEACWPLSVPSLIASLAAIGAGLAHQRAQRLEEWLRRKA